TSDLERALALDPNDEETLYNLASLYGNVGRYSDAIDLYNRAMDVSDAHDDIIPLYRGQMYHAAGDEQNALTDIQSFLLNHQGWDDFNTTGTLVRATIDLYLGDYASADASYRAAIIQERDFVVHFHEYGAGYRVTPLRENRIDELKAQIVASPQNADLVL